MIARMSGVATEVGCYLRELSRLRRPAAWRGSGALHRESPGEPGRRPVVLVHGLAADRASFSRLLDELCRTDRPVFSFAYGLGYRDARVIAAEFGKCLAGIRAGAGGVPIDVVGHSLGGLVARYHVQRQGGAPAVRRLVTLGTPHHGTVAAWLGLPHPLVAQLRPGSALFAELALPAAGIGTEIVTVHSDADQIVFPHSSGRCVHPDLDVRTIAVSGIGHLSLCHDRATVGAVLAELNRDAWVAAEAAVA